MTWSSIISAVLVGSWLGLRAVEAWNRDIEEEERERQARIRNGPPSHRNVPIPFVRRSEHGTSTGQGPGTGEGHGGPIGLEALNAIDPVFFYLAMMNRDFTDEDYEMLRFLDRNNSGQGHAVSQGALDALPQHSFHARAKGASQSNPATADRSKSSSGSSASPYHTASQHQYGRGSGDRARGAEAGSHLRLRGSASGSDAGVRPSAPPRASVIGDAPSVSSGSTETHRCSICLEDFREGDQVTSLPCFHQYHSPCVQPWLRQQGSNSTCPECKTPVFG